MDRELEGDLLMAVKSKATALAAGLGVLIIAGAGTGAHAGGYGSKGGGESCGCQPMHHKPQHNQQNVGVKQNVNVYVNVVTKSNANASSSSVASANASANAAAATTVMSRFMGLGQTMSGGGGGSASFVTPGPVSALQLNTSAADSTAYDATRTRVEKVAIQAFCFDDKDVPHPASQVFPDRDVPVNYEGEIYRCIAGTHMQATIAPWGVEKISFAGGQTLACNKGEALYHIPGKDGGRLECRPQIPARDCNERSLLRRFGAGIKVMTLMTTEKYTAYREESHDGGATAITLDGGVGGFVN
jgi:hypothetical protein